MRLITRSLSHCYVDLQALGPPSTTSIVGSGMGPHFIFAEGVNEFRDATNIRCLRHSVHTFNPIETEDVLNIKLEPVAPGKQEIHPHLDASNLRNQKKNLHMHSFNV
jgi:hypothetical protein